MKDQDLGDIRLGEVIRKWRIWSDLVIEDVARDIGISKATLSRLERGHCPDGVTLSRVVNWLMARQPRGRDPK